MHRFPSVSLLLLLPPPPEPGVKRPPTKRYHHRGLVCTNTHAAYGLADPTIAPSRPPSHSATRQTWTMKTENYEVMMMMMIARTAKIRPNKGRTLRVLVISPWQSWHHFSVRLQLLPAEPCPLVLFLCLCLCLCLFFSQFSRYQLLLREGNRKIRSIRKILIRLAGLTRDPMYDIVGSRQSW
jgi:hypothetical protein